MESSGSLLVQMQGVTYFPRCMARKRHTTGDGKGGHKSRFDPQGRFTWSQRILIRWSYSTYLLVVYQLLTAGYQWYVFLSSAL